MRLVAGLIVLAFFFAITGVGGAVMYLSGLPMVYLFGHQEWIVLVSGIVGVAASIGFAICAVNFTGPQIYWPTAAPKSGARSGEISPGSHQKS